MAEEVKKKEFAKTKELTFEEIKGLVDKYGTLKVGGFPTNSHVVVKLVGPVSSEEYEYEGLPTTTHSIPIEYKAEQMTAPAPLKLQIGETAAARLVTDFPDNTYVGLHAFVSKTVFPAMINNKMTLTYPQFINPFKNVLFDKDKMFAVVDKHTEPLPSVTEALKQAKYADLLDSVTEELPTTLYGIPEAERNTIMDCKLLIELKRGKEPDTFKGLNATQWINLLVKKGIAMQRATAIVKGCAKDLEVVQNG